MTWRLYALSSGGAVMVTALATFFAPTKPTQNTPGAEPQAGDRSGVVVDLGAQADQIKAKLAVVTGYQTPARDAFKFNLAPRPVVTVPAPSEAPIAPAVTAPARPPYALAGMATTVENGVTQRTAILSALQGVSLVKEGDVLDTGYRVVSIGDEAVVLESSTDGVQTTLRLPGSDPR